MRPHSPLCSKKPRSLWTKSFSLRNYGEQHPIIKTPKYTPVGSLEVHSLATNNAMAAFGLSSRECDRCTGFSIARYPIHSKHEASLGDSNAIFADMAFLSRAGFESAYIWWTSTDDLSYPALPKKPHEAMIRCWWASTVTSARDEDRGRMNRRIKRNDYYYYYYYYYDPCSFLPSPAALLGREREVQRVCDVIQDEKQY